MSICLLTGVLCCPGDEAHAWMCDWTPDLDVLAYGRDTATLPTSFFPLSLF